LETGPSQIAERVMQALEAADASVAGLPGRVAGVVLVALGSSAAEQQELARQITRLFRDDMLSAIEATVHLAVLRLGASPNQGINGT
jgi:hypothetical protein